MISARSRLHWAPSYAARVSLIVVGTAIGGATLPARADVVTIWNEKAIELLPKMGKQGPFNLRGLAMMHAAMFNAVNVVERKYSPFKVDLTASKDASAEAAAAAAARRILVELVPQQREAIDATFRATMANISDGDAKSRGSALGEDVAVKIALWRGDDRSDKPIGYVPKTGPGSYVATSSSPMIAPHWGQVVPWVMISGSQFRPGQPPTLDSEQWKRDLAETMSLGGKDSAKRTADQTVIAKFHAPPEFPVWNAIARAVVTEKRLSLAASARLFALLNLAMADAHIAVYDAKYTYNFWRPVTAIHAGSAGIAADPNWEPLIATPMHPEYPCAHCTVGGAARAVMEAELGTAVSFTTSTEALPDTKRKYPSFAAFAEEEAYSRILGGIHYRNSLMTGAAMGRKIGEQAITTIMRPQS
jgi:PAP2 superfamily protein